MAKTYKVLVNDGKGAESVAVQVAQGAGDKGTPVRLVAQRGVRYELQDVTKGKGVAPDQVRAKRVGNNLALMFDGSQNPDVVIEDYYIVKGEGAAPMLAGLAENGGVYEYIPQDPNANHLTPSLKDGNTPVLMALGGGVLGEAFVLSALPIVAAAAGGISGWAIAAGVVGAAALGGGGGGGGTPPTDTTARGAALVAIPEASGGVNATEAADGTALDVALPADAVVGDTLTTVVTRPDGSTFNLVHVVTAADIADKGVRQSIPEASLKDANGKYIDGTWTTTTTLTDAAKNVSTAATGSFVLDTTAPAAYTGNLKHDAANDTGINSDDSVTKNATPVLQINAETGAKVEVDINGKTYAATETATKGTYEVQVTDVLPNATYNPVVRVTDAVGNTTVNGVFVGFTVAASGGASGPISSTRTISIVAISDDTGTSGTDFVTTDQTLKVSGQVTGLTNADIAQGKRVFVQFLNVDGLEVSHEYVTPQGDVWQTSTDTATLAVGRYSIKASIVDVAGNSVLQTSQSMEISAGSLIAMPDKASATEDAGVNLEGNVLSGTSVNHDGADVDVQFSYGANIFVNALIAGTGAIAASNVFSDSAVHSVDGRYGRLSIQADGSYRYELSNAAQALQAGQVEHDVFTYQVKNAAGLTSTSTLTMDVHGVNDVARINGTQSFQMSFDGIGKFHRETTLITISDPDQGESFFSNILTTSNTTLTGRYGKLLITPVSNGYTWEYDKKTSPNGTATVHDLFVFQSADGTAAETFDITLTNSTLQSQEFHTSSIAGLTATGSDTTTDTLVLHGGSLNFDFTSPTPSAPTATGIKSISSIEKIDITGTGNNTIHLSLASLVQADVKQLTIDGDSGDAVQLKLDSGSALTNAGLVNGYDVYRLTNADQTDTYELVVQHTINTVVLS